MIFYVTLAVLALIAAGVLMLVVIYGAHGDADGVGFTLFVGLTAALIPGAMTFIPWGFHASDLSRIFAQDEVIKVQVEQIESLTTRLDKFNYPRSALLNADTPVAAIVTAINDAEKRLAYAKTEKAEAIRSIEQRRYGPFSGVIQFVGDYK